MMFWKDEGGMYSLDIRSQEKMIKKFTEGDIDATRMCNQWFEEKIKAALDVDVELKPKYIAPPENLSPIELLKWYKEQVKK